MATHALRLRAVDTRLCRLRQAAAAWAARGWPAQLQAGPARGAWLAIGDPQQRWQGWIDARAWLAQRDPDLARLGWCAALREQLALRLQRDAQPLRQAPPELGAGALRIGAWSAALPPATPLLRLESDGVTIWLWLAPPVAPACLRWLRWPVDAALGFSRIALHTLRRVASGDILLLRQPQQRLLSQGLDLGAYRIADQEIQMNDDQASAPSMWPDTGDAPDPLGQLPVRLEFVLQRTMLDLDALRALLAGQPLALQPGCEQAIEIRVNGQWIGRGELVQLDGRLGVEVVAWSGGDAA